MRPQRRLYEVCLVRFLAFRVLCSSTLVNHQIIQFNAETKSQASNRHIFYSFGSSLQSHPLWGNPVDVILPFRAQVMRN